MPCCFHHCSSSCSWAEDVEKLVKLLEGAPRSIPKIPIACQIWKGGCSQCSLVMFCETEDFPDSFAPIVSSRRASTLYAEPQLAM